jgi:hypothetical protein
MSSVPEGNDRRSHDREGPIVRAVVRFWRAISDVVTALDSAAIITATLLPPKKVSLAQGRDPSVFVNSWRFIVLISRS